MDRHIFWRENPDGWLMKKISNRYWYGISNPPTKSRVAKKRGDEASDLFIIPRCYQRKWRGRCLSYWRSPYLNFLLPLPECKCHFPRDSRNRGSVAKGQSAEIKNRFRSAVFISWCTTPLRNVTELSNRTISVSW